jgi:hypothetical protein
MTKTGIVALTMVGTVVMLASFALALALLATMVI